MIVRSDRHQGRPVPTSRRRDFVRRSWGVGPAPAGSRPGYVATPGPPPSRFLILRVFKCHDYKLPPEGVIMSATCEFDTSGIAPFGDEGQQNAYIRLAAELGYRSLLAAVMDWQGCRERRAKMLAVRFSNGSIEQQRTIADGFLAWLRAARIRTGEPWQPSRRDFDAIHGGTSSEHASGKKAA